MNLTQNILIYILENSSILIFSFLLHLSIFIFIHSGYLGDPLKVSFECILHKTQNLLITYIFFVSLILIFFFNNAIYLDDKITITTTIENVKFEISGELIQSCFNNIGSAGVFTVGAKIAASLLAKSKLGLLPKTGIIGGTGLGFTVSFKLLNQTLPSTPSSIETITIETGPIELVAELKNKTSADLIVEHFGIFKNISKNNPVSKISDNFTKDLHNNLNFNITPEDTAKIIKELNETSPNWRNDFILPNFTINSPLESNSSIIQFVLDALNNHLIINFVTVYLLLMLLIILICKFNINKNITFNRLDKYPFGTYINKFLTKYISIWQQFGNIWIFFILIPLIFFNTVVTFSTYQLILLLK